MKKYKIQFSIILISFFCFISINTFCQNYRQYYKYINKAELEANNNKHENSIVYYDSAFALNAPLPLHLKHAFKESTSLKDFDKCTDYLDFLVNCGVDVTPDINSMNYADEYKETSYYKNFIKDYNEKLKIKQQNFDSSLIIQLKNISITDQQYRMTDYEKGDTSYYKAMKEMDIKNFYLLRNIVEEKGWPNYKKAGTLYAGVANIVLLHGSRYFSLDSEEWIFFESTLKKEIEDGNFYPITLAQWTDQHLILIEKSNQKYGSVANANMELFPVENPEKIDSIRAEIYLEPLKDYMSKKGYTIKPNN